MLITTRRPARAASALVASGIFAVFTGTAAGQSVFNPYLPYNGDLAGFTAPIMPNNLALPNAARASAEYNREASTGAVSRFNTFDRWLSDYESDIARGRRTGTPGAARDSVDRNDLSRYIPNRKADAQFFREEEERNRRFFSGEEERARIAQERDRYFAAASRVTDPARRAAYLKVVEALRDPKTARAMLREIDEAQAAQRGEPAARGEPAPASPLGESIRSNPATLAPRTRSSTPSNTSPTSSAGRDASAPAPPTTMPDRERRSILTVPDARPAPPPDLRPRPARPTGPAPLPSPGSGTTSPTPESLPDELPPPPR